DRGSFPSEIAAGHFVHRHGPQRLQRWGLLDRITASGAPPITQMTSYFGDFLLTADNVQLQGVPWGIGPRRKVLDQILIDSAITAGAEFLPNTAIQTVLEERNRVVGVSTASGQRICARLTVGADGRHSRVA